MLFLCSENELFNQSELKRASWSRLCNKWQMSQFMQFKRQVTLFTGLFDNVYLFHKYPVFQFQITELVNG